MALTEKIFETNVNDTKFVAAVVKYEGWANGSMMYEVAPYDEHNYRSLERFAHGHGS